MVAACHAQTWKTGRNNGDHRAEARWSVVRAERGWHRMRLGPCTGLGAASPPGADMASQRRLATGQYHPDGSGSHVRLRRSGKDDRSFRASKIGGLSRAGRDDALNFRFGRRIWRYTSAFCERRDLCRAGARGSLSKRSQIEQQRRIFLRFPVWP